MKKSAIKEEINRLASEHLGFPMELSCSGYTAAQLEKRRDAYRLMAMLDSKATAILRQFDPTLVAVAAIFPQNVPADTLAEIERAWAMKKQATELWQSN